jgi:hypothetical protein
MPTTLECENATAAMSSVHRHDSDHVLFALTVCQAIHVVGGRNIPDIPDWAVLFLLRNQLGYRVAGDSLGTLLFSKIIVCICSAAVAASVPRAVEHMRSSLVHVTA